ncbi:MAG: T9SS type A sorting domain-containing protein, partial [Candidatus Marinimicrobia bacterium]|nr:T9SS type A sorting domain-containing protein [Candidatus Neomarinimicrobiota bacterium]
QYDNCEEVFGELDNPEEYQFGLNGTFALMLGFYLGLPSLTDTSGGSSAGKFGLMDQGSANLNSLVPALPSAWERVYMGWEDPILIQDDHNHINLNHAESNQDSLILKVPIDNDEYYLIENRYNFLHDNTNLDTIRSREMREYEDKYKDVYPPVLPLVKDSIGAQFSKNGVLLSVPRYDVGIPGSGLMIWHIDESIITRHINDNLVNISEYERGVDLEEGDGAQDLGFEASILVEEKATGWSVDPWYEGNQGFFHLNPEYTSSSGERVGFTPNTTPNTSNNKHAFSGIYIDSIGLAGPTMNFRVQWDKESGSNIDLALPSDFQAYDMLPINLQSDTLNGLAVLGKELLVLDALTQEDKKVYSDNSFDIGKYSKATLLFDNNARLLYALAESEESFKVVCWEIDNNGKISFLDEKEKSGEKVTSNSVLANGAVLIGAVSNGENLIYKFKLLNEKVSLSEKTVNKKINALAGNSDNLYYLADGSVGTINADNLQPIEILADGKIHGDKIILGLADNNSALDLIFSDDRRLGIIKDVSNNDELRTIKTSSINGISFSDIDFDGRGEILVSTNNGDLEVYNSELYLKNNFPVNFSATFIGEPLSSDLTENDVNDILLLSKSGELYGVDNKANYTANLPIATEIENADQGCLINTSKGIGLISLNRRTGKLAGKVIGTGKISETAWYCEGGNINRSYIHSAWTDGESPKVQSVLNKAKTFCWPNPVKGNSTNLRYYLNKSGQVKIKIYDLAGNFVHSLQDESPAEREANEIQWDVSNIESGVYFAVVKATDESGSSQKEIIKIMVIK